MQSICVRTHKQANRNNWIYLRHLEGDQANDYAVGEKLEEDDGTKDVLNLVRETANQCN